MRSRPLDDAPLGTCRHEVDGITVNDSAITYLRICRVLDDASLAVVEKLRITAALLDPSDMGACMERMATVLDGAFGITVSVHQMRYEGGKPFDWDEDAGRIRASLLMAYGIDWDTWAPTHAYRDAVDLLSGLLESGDTPFQQAVLYRTGRKPKYNGHNQERIEAWNRMAAHYALDDDGDPYGDGALSGI